MSIPIENSTETKTIEVPHPNNNTEEYYDNNYWKVNFTECDITDLI